MIHKRSISLAEAIRSVGPGWARLIEQVYEKAAQLKTTIYFNTVKEKFGLLRIYFDVVTVEFGDNEDEDKEIFYDEKEVKDLYDLVAKLEEDSGSICETCGSPGKLRNLPWITCLCNTCYNEGN